MSLDLSLMFFPTHVPLFLAKLPSIVWQVAQAPYRHWRNKDLEFAMQFKRICHVTFYLWHWRDTIYQFDLSIANLICVRKDGLASGRNFEDLNIHVYAHVCISAFSVYVCFKILAYSDAPECWRYAYGQSDPPPWHLNYTNALKKTSAWNKLLSSRSNLKRLHPIIPARKCVLGCFKWAEAARSAATEGTLEKGWAVMSLRRFGRSVIGQMLRMLEHRFAGALFS